VSSGAETSQPARPPSHPAQPSYHLARPPSHPARPPSHPARPPSHLARPKYGDAGARLFEIIPSRRGYREDVAQISCITSPRILSSRLPCASALKSASAARFRLSSSCPDSAGTAVVELWVRRVPPGRASGALGVPLEPRIDPARPPSHPAQPPCHSARPTSHLARPPSDPAQPSCQPARPPSHPARPPPRPAQPS